MIAHYLQIIVPHGFYVLLILVNFKTVHVGQISGYLGKAWKVDVEDSRRRLVSSIGINKYHEARLRLNCV